MKKDVPKQALILAIAIFSAIVIVMGASSQARAKKTVMEIHEECYEKGYSFVGKIEQEDGNFCIKCYDIHKYEKLKNDQKKMSANIITVCSSDI